MSTAKPSLPASTPAPKHPAAPRGTAPGLALGFEDIQTLIGLVGREAIDELEFESLGLRLHIRKHSSVAADPQPAQAPAPLSPSRTPTAPPSAEAEPVEDPGIHHITSPIVGTFYRAPSASASAFVQPGDFVKPGQTLCIIEAMKLMNEIECDVAGEVVAVLVENGQPVEYGECLFAIRVR